MKYLVNFENHVDIFEVLKEAVTLNYANDHFHSYTYTRGLLSSPLSHDQIESEGSNSSNFSSKCHEVK